MLVILRGLIMPDGRPDWRVAFASYVFRAWLIVRLLVNYSPLFPPCLAIRSLLLRSVPPSVGESIDALNQGGRESISQFPG
jgi:hypothetical protein